MCAAQKPLVSVVIPTYNHARYLGTALQSVLDQSYPNWEIIVVDNHSTDNTDEIVAGFADSRITCLKIHNHGVIAASRNTGIREAKGDWIGFLDSDDWWAHDKLKVCFDMIDEHVDFVYHDLHIVRQAPSRFKRSRTKGRQVGRPVLKDLLLKGNPIATSSVLVRKQFLEKIGGFDEGINMIAAEDYHAWMRIALLTENFLYIPRELGFYLFHAGGASRKNIERLLEDVCREFIGHLDEREHASWRATMYYVVALNDFYSGKASSARQNLFYSIRHGSPAIKAKSLAIYLLSVAKSGSES